MSLPPSLQCQTVAGGLSEYLATATAHRAARRRREFAWRTTIWIQTGTGTPDPGNQWETGEPPVAHPPLPVGLEFRPMNNHTLFFTPLEYVVLNLGGNDQKSFILPTASRRRFLTSGLHELEVDRVDFRQVHRCGSPQKTPSGILHPFDPPGQAQHRH